MGNNKSIKKIIRIGLPILIIVIVGIIVIMNDQTNSTLLSLFNRTKVIVEVDGNIIEHISKGDNVTDLLNELNISIDENDKINKNLKENLVMNETIKITRVELKEEIITEKIEFENKEVIDYKMPVGEKRVICEGSNGEKTISYEVIYEDGIEVDRVLKEEKVIVEAIDNIVAEGSFQEDSLTVLVNQKRPVDSSYEPSDLVVPQVRSAVSNDRILLREEAARNLEKMFQAAEADGIYLYAVSGYRSYYYQQSIYNPTSGYSAPPGTSEHQLGLAMDVTTSYYGSNLLTEFGYTEEGIWVENNAHKFGFHLRYLLGKEDITGYFYEPWHLRYVGVDLATDLFESGLTMEEHFGEY